MKKTTLAMALLSLFATNLTFATNNPPGAVTLSLGDAYYHFANKRHLDNVWMPNVALA